MSGLPQSPADRLASLRVALDCAARGEVDTAYRLTLAVLAGGLADNDLLHLAGLAVLHAGEPDIAQAMFQEVLRRDPGHIWSRIEIANAHDDAGRSAEALAAYQWVVTARDAPAQVVARVAELLRDAGRTRDARMMLASALTSEPANEGWNAMMAELEAAETAPG